MKIYIAKLTLDKKIEKSFYIEDIHGLKLCESVLSQNGIQIDDDMHTYLSSITGEIDFNGVIDKNKVYSMEDKELFKVTEIPLNTTPQLPSEMDLLKEEVLQQSESMVDMDFRLTSLELGL